MYSWLVSILAGAHNKWAPKLATASTVIHVTVIILDAQKPTSGRRTNHRCKISHTLDACTITWATTLSLMGGQVGIRDMEYGDVPTTTTHPTGVDYSQIA